MKRISARYAQQEVTISIKKRIPESDSGIDVLLDSSMEREKQAFLEYASGFDEKNTRIALKTAHMLRVADISLYLARSLRLGAPMVEIAYLCGLYHDVGRFRQVEMYGTFSDAASVDHADLGCEIIAREGLLETLGVRERQMVLDAIGNHNKYRIDPGIVDGDTLTLCKLIRDADKVDIYRVFATESIEAITGETKEQLEKGRISSDVFKCLEGCRCVEGRLRKTSIDKLVGILGFLYDINYDESISLIRRQGYYRTLFEQVEPQDDAVRRQLDVLLAIAEAYIDERAGCR